MTELENLMQGLLDEITRVTELITVYETLPKNAGMLGSMMMSRKIDIAKSNIATGDVIDMIRSYKELKNCE